MTPPPVCSDLCQARQPPLTLPRMLTTPTWIAACPSLPLGAAIEFFFSFLASKTNREPDQQNKVKTFYSNLFFREPCASCKTRFD